MENLFVCALCAALANYCSDNQSFQEIFVAAELIELTVKQLCWRYCLLNGSSTADKYASPY